MLQFDWHIAIRPFGGMGNACGDTGVITAAGSECFLALVDILGKGPEAAALARLAADYLEHNSHLEPIAVLEGFHLHLKGTRGAVAAVCRLDLSTGLLRYAGIGNISTRLFGVQNARLLPRDGVIGYMMSSPREHSLRMGAGDVLIMHSDGVKEHIDPLLCRDLWSKPASAIAAGMIEKFGKREDDASCIALRCSHG